MPNMLASRSALLNGIFAVDKPAGITSAKVVDFLKAAVIRDLMKVDQKTCTDDGNIKRDDASLKAGLDSRPDRRTRKRTRNFPKMGHGGTLDMNATGVLVIACGSATKSLSQFLHGGKVYVAEGRFGKATDTMDAYGKEVETAEYRHITSAMLQDTLQQFTGDIQQVPPIYSALKVKGERMSDLAIRGVEVEAKPARPVQIYSAHCHSFNPPDFQIEVHCGGGVYIRKLIHDIGKSLGTCAYMTSLCRTQQGCFTLQDDAIPQEKWTLDNILNAMQSHKINSAVK